MVFFTSKKEVNRRKVAFVELFISLFVGMALFSKLFHRLIPISFYLLLATILFLLGLSAFHFLKVLLKMKLVFTENEIERIKGSLIEKYNIHEIISIVVKRRKTGEIREIYIRFTQGKRLYISAFEEDFEVLYTVLKTKIQSGIPTQDYCEKFDFDHLLFYPGLGFALSFGFLCSLDLIIEGGFWVIKTYIYVVSAVSLGISLYFAFNKPIAIRSGKNQSWVDYAFAIFMLLCAIFVYFRDV